MSELIENLCVVRKVFRLLFAKFAVFGLKWFCRRVNVITDVMTDSDILKRVE